MPIDFLNELRWRGLFNQCTDEAALRDHLGAPGRAAYVGYDPTADSLTIGNLVTIMLLKHWQRAGHKPVVLSGGGTGLIGDPSGKTAERQLRTKDEVAANVASQRRIFESLLDFDGPDTASAVILNNLDWLGELSYIDALRDVGKHFSVNMMMQKESVKARLESREQGISYTEFSYMILQAYDFAHLYEHHGVTVQLGGSDQYGNIVAGTDLIRRQHAQPHQNEADETTHETAPNASEEHAPAFGLTCPLITKAGGGKFGKTETGAVWLTPERTSPYAYFQFWLNASDDDVASFLRIFTLLDRDEIEALEARHAEQPGAREAQRRLAQEATALLHGHDAAAQAESAGKALFSGDITGLDERTFREVMAEVPSSDHPKANLEGDGADPVELLVQTGLAESKKKAREFIAAGSVLVNGRKLASDERLKTADLLHGSMIAIRRGKKNWALPRWG